MYAKYVRIPSGLADTEGSSNMRFQFMFSRWGEANEIISSLPHNLKAALGTPYSEGRAPPGSGPDVEGKYVVWYEDVSLSVGEAKQLMNRVVEAGGGIYEAFLS